MMAATAMEFPTRFETERLIVRRYEAGDGGWYYAAGQKNRSHLEKYESGNVIFDLKSAAEAENAIQGMLEDWAAGRCFFLGAIEKTAVTNTAGEFAAQIYIGATNWDILEFEIGYIADKDHEGRGYVTEAVKGCLAFLFKNLQAERVWLECDDTNLRSCRVAERCGFTLEAHFRNNKRHPNGTLTGTVVYGLLKEEYEKTGLPG
jgi:ribosomal-protein-alanine N-acetyltransferase